MYKEKEQGYEEVAGVCVRIQKNLRTEDANFSNITGEKGKKIA